MLREQIPPEKLHISLGKSLFFEEVGKHYWLAKSEGREPRFWRLAYEVYRDRWPTDDPGFYHSMGDVSTSMIACQMYADHPI